MIRIGILGTANIAERSIIPALLELRDQFELVGVASRKYEKALEFSKKFKVKCFDSYEAILDISLIDAVYIPLPNSLHYEWVKRSIELGIHVLVEKSLACIYHDVFELTVMARKRNIALIENFQFRFHPQMNIILERIENGDIGEVKHMRSAFEFPPFNDINNIRYQKELGGGALLDAGAYPIKISQLILGEKLEVSSSLLKLDERFGVDIGGAGMLVHKKSGMFSLISFGFDNYYQCTLEVFGTKGKISTNRIFTCPPGHSATILVQNENGENIIEVNPSNHFKNMLIHFYTVINNDSLKSEEYEQNLAQAKLLEEFKNYTNA